MERKRLPLERPPLFTAIFCDDSVERLSRQAKAAWTMVDNRFDFKTLDPTLDGAEKPRTVKTPCRFGFTKRIPEPDNVVQWCREAGRVFPDTVTMLKPGTYALAVG